ncbi:MAG: hypothetical protein ACP5QP_07165, partial [Brevinematia bacterium]
ERGLLTDWPDGVMKIWDEEEWITNGPYWYSPPLPSLKPLLRSNNISNVAIGTYIKIKKGTNEVVISGFPDSVTNVGLGSYGLLWYEGEFDGIDKLTNCAGIFPKGSNLTTNTTSFIPPYEPHRKPTNTNYVCEVFGYFNVEDNKISGQIRYGNIFYTDYKNRDYYTNFEISF